MNSMRCGSGMSAGLSTTSSVPSVRWMRYSTLGAVAISAEAELALEALLDDLHVQQPEEATAEAEPEGAGRLRRVRDRRIVKLQLSNESRRSSKSSPSMGKSPEKTIGFGSR